MAQVDVFWDWDGGWIKHDPKAGWHPVPVGKIDSDLFDEYEQAQKHLYELETKIQKELTNA